MSRHRYFYGTKKGPSVRDPTCNRETGLFIFSNFATAPFDLDGHRWMTSEHYYQAQKFAVTDPDWSSKVRTTKTAREAKALGSSKTHIISPIWNMERDDVMLRALRAKFSQNPNARAVLLSTGTDILHEDAGKNDYYWGIGHQFRVGEDKLGILLMKVRAELQAQ